MQVYNNNDNLSKTDYSVGNTSLVFFLCKKKKKRKEREKKESFFLGIKPSPFFRDLFKTKPYYNTRMMSTGRLTTYLVRSARKR